MELGPPSDDGDDGGDDDWDGDVDEDGGGDGIRSARNGGSDLFGFLLNTSTWNSLTSLPYVSEKEKKSGNQFAYCHLSILGLLG